MFFIPPPLDRTLKIDSLLIVPKIETIPEIKLGVEMDLL